jgi:hypothetical protein
VLGHENAGTGAGSGIMRSADIVPRVCIYSDPDGGLFSESQLCFERKNHEEFFVTVLNVASSLPNLEGSHDINRVDHLVLNSHDADACISRFGEAGFGMRLALDKNVPEWGGRMLFFRCGKLTLEVIVPSKETGKADLFWGIAYQAVDIDLCTERFKHNDIEFSAVRNGRKPNTLVSTIKSHTLGIPTLLVQP